MKTRHRLRMPAIGGILAAHVAIVVWQAATWSPTLDEVGHLPAGISIWKLGRFDLYRVNPPLVKAIAAIPAVIGGAEVDWRGYGVAAFGRPEWSVGRGFIKANGESWFRWYFWARLAVLPFTLIGACVCYAWSRELYGDAAGLLSLCLWCFSPNILTWASTITPDLGATSLGLLAAWSFWKWLRSPSWGAAIVAGMALGFAQLAKMTLVLFFAVWPLLYIAWLVFNRRSLSSDSKGQLSEVKQLCVILLLGLYVLNLGYAFEGTFTKLGEYTFGSRFLAGERNILDARGGAGGNRFADTNLAWIPVPLPKDYLTGLDLQKMDFERKMQSYLCGEWKQGGWWYYYIVAVWLKVPLGTLLLLILTALWAVSFNSREETSREIALLLPAIALFAFVSSQTGFSRYLRYVLPAFPYAFIWCGKLASPGIPLRRFVRTLACGGLCWSVVSSMAVLPHSLSYFNELAGGPHGGHRYLLDANVDWGQDLFHLKAWIDDHPEARPIYCHLKTTLPLDSIGLPEPPRNVDISRYSGWFAVDVHTLMATERYAFLLEETPYARVGYALRISKLTARRP